jgi:protein-disulfide isomerase
VFRDFPIDQIHPQARKAAEAAHCAGEQGNYWEMHDVLYRNPAALGVPQLGEHARKVGLDAARFDECLASGRQAAQVDRVLADGVAAGVQGTPGFSVARTQTGDTAEGIALRGAQPVDAFRRLVDQLSGQKEK